MSAPRAQPCTLALGLSLVAWSQSSAAQTSATCFPPCRAGYVCQQGYCVTASATVPPAAAAASPPLAPQPVSAQSAPVPTAAQEPPAGEPAAPPVSAAPTQPVVPPGYIEAITGAVEEYGAGNFEEARSLFELAHRIHPNARTLRGLGMVEFELRNYRAAVDLLQAALSSTERPLDAPLRGTTHALLQRAQSFLGHLTLVVRPQAARVLLDGVPTAPSANPIVLQVGDHELEVRAAGHQSERRSIQVKGGDQQTLSIALQPIPAPTPSARAVNQASDPGPWPWVVMGTSAGAIVSGIVLLAMAQSDIATVEDAQRGKTWAELQDAYDGAPTKSTVGIVLLGAGTVGLGIGLVWKITASDRTETSQMTVAIGAGRIAVSGRF